MAKIILIEDDLSFTQLIEGFLRKNGYEVDTRSSAREGLKALEQTDYQLSLLDYRLPDGNGLDILATLRKKGMTLPAIMMTSFHDVRTAVKAIRLGAMDYITKPVNPDELLMVIREALQNKQQGRSSHIVAPEHYVKGIGMAAKQLHEHIQLVAPTEMSVIIQGESGTGKENVARSIHQQSKRKGAPFVAIDCGALSEELASSELFGHIKGAFTGAMNDKKGQFEAANGGTLFLDEVGNLSYGVQVKLLRAIQERIIQPLGSTKSIPVNVRIITATNDDLVNSVRNNAFREDLYHRLNEFKIRVPALRERSEDLEEFIHYFITTTNAELGKQVLNIAPDVMDIFRKYDWPGNLRELKNVIKRSVLLSSGTTLEKDVLPDEMVLSSFQVPNYNGSDLKLLKEQNERERIIQTLLQVKYNKSKAAALLNIDRKTLYLKLAKYNIEL